MGIVGGAEVNSNLERQKKTKQISKTFFSPLSCPMFLGHTRSERPLLARRAGTYGRDLRCSGGAGKAEAAKLPGVGIGPKQCPAKCAAEKGTAYRTR